MPEQKIKGRMEDRPKVSTGQSRLNLTLISITDPTPRALRVSPGMSVSALLELALEKLNGAGGAQLLETLQRYYQPLLELQAKDGNYQLPLHASLEEAGVRDGATLRVAARPLSLTLLSSSDNTPHQFNVSPEMKVAAFLELALAKLSEGNGAKRVEALKRYYQPVLELQARDGGRELETQASLAEEGVRDGAVFRIAARPLKERIMFCRYG